MGRSYQRAASRWLGPRLVECARCGHQKTVDPIRPTALVSASAALRLRVYLDQGTDLPSTALPSGALPCVLKAQMRKLIAVRSLLASLWLGGRAVARNESCG